MLSIQSSVAYGHVGNSAAVFPMQRIGVEVIPVPTVIFSNHPAHGGWRGAYLEPELVHEVILGIEDRGVLGEVDVVLSGYLGSEGIADVVLDAVARVAAANPAAIYACDPVIGNAARGSFVVEGLPELIRDRVVPAADILTPNQFELGYLTGRASDSVETILEAVDVLRDRGPRTVLVTSVERADAPDDAIEMLVVDDAGGWMARTPRLPFHANGSGDVTAALFTAHYRESGDAADALARTTSSVFDLLERTHLSGARELQLVEAQEAYASPRMQFAVERLR